MLEGLASKGISPRAIFVEKRNAGGVISRVKKLYKRKGLFALSMEIVKFISARLGVKKKSERTSITYYQKFCKDIHYFDSLNNDGCIDELKSLQADIVILAGTGIIKEAVIRSVKLFFLNAHPGELPYYRGVDVMEAAILNGDKPCVTIHKVDAGVDTGNILDIRKIPLERGDSFDSLRAKAVEVAKDMISDIVDKVIKGIPLDERENPIEKGKQFFMMKKSELRKAKEQLRKITH